MLNPTPRQILETLLPYLQVAAAYSHQIQPQIAAHPDKDRPENFFAAALSDADLSVQTLVEVALLGNFPEIRFYGEEHQKSFNTKYFRAMDLGPQGDYLVTLDPIDGTRFYLDHHANYQMILGILDREEFAAAIAISPAQNIYYYALRGEGAFKGSLDHGLAACSPLQVEPTNARVYLGWGLGGLAPQLKQGYEVLDLAAAYSQEVQVPNLNGVLSGELTGAMIKSANFLDGAALAFIAAEAGWIVTTFDGSPPPPLYTCRGYQRPGLVVASSAAVHQDLLAAVQAADKK